jgi:molybdopterin molybdotransferase
MITVEQAEKIILSEAKDYGSENIYFENAIGRVLAQAILADRDMPAFNRVTMDGIAIRYASFQHGIRSFKIIATQAAGDDPVDIQNEADCIEIMTGAALPATTDTVIRYEDLEIKEGIATIANESITKGQSIHGKGKDKKQDEIAAQANQFITGPNIQIAAAVGNAQLCVKKLPAVVVVSSGDELVEINEIPSPYQVRTSNNYAIKTALEKYGIVAGMLHIPDDEIITQNEMAKCLQQYDIIILSGGVSEGKFDYIPKALETCGVRKLFHKVQQRPGKPFWFGKHDNGVLVFAFPGNPVSTFMCLHRYFFPWLEASFAIPQKFLYAALNADFVFNPPLKYFLQVKLQINKQAILLATPFEGNGSGDFSNLVDTDAFMELPAERSHFSKGEVFRVWPFQVIGS